jgi:hypothetical protein
MPSVICPECSADCLIITPLSQQRRHSCPLCGTALPSPEAIRGMGMMDLNSVRAARARLSRLAAGRSSARASGRPRFVSGKPKRPSAAPPGDEMWQQGSRNPGGDATTKRQ